MKRFLFKIALFVLPIIILIIGVEFYFRNSTNAFITKAKYFNSNKENIEVLILGSSHNQNGLNPKYFSKKTANLANGSQDIKIDSALFFNNVKQMKNLKTVIFEMDYHRMDIENEADFYRLPWYYIYFKIEVAPIKWFNKLSLYSSNTTFFNDNLISKFKSGYKEQVINEYGFVDENFDSQFRNQNYDSIQIVTSAKERLKSRHKEFSNAIFNQNKKRIEAMINYCSKNKIQLVFTSSPLYKTYRDNEDVKKKIRFNNFIEQLKKNPTISYYNFDDSNEFVLKDFKDDDHLTPDGAKKYSEIVDKLINK